MCVPARWINGTLFIVLYVRMYVGIYVCMYTYTDYVHMHTYNYEQMCTHTYIYIHIYIYNTQDPLQHTVMQRFYLRSSLPLMRLHCSCDAVGNRESSCGRSLQSLDTTCMVTGKPKPRQVEETTATCNSCWAPLTTAALGGSSHL